MQPKPKLEATLTSKCRNQSKGLDFPQASHLSVNPNRVCFHLHKLDSPLALSPSSETSDPLDTFHLLLVCSLVQFPEASMVSASRHPLGLRGSELFFLNDPFLYCAEQFSYFLLKVL